MPQMRRRMAAQLDKQAHGPETGPERPDRRPATGEPVRKQGGHRHQAGRDQVAPTPEPAAVGRIRHRMAGTGALRSRAQARFRLGGQRRRLKIVQRARKPGRKAARQQRPCHVGIPAIPAGDVCIPPTRLAPVGAVAGKAAAAAGVRGAAIKPCVAPGLRGNVVPAGQRQIPVELHGRLSARRSAPHGPPLLPNSSHHAQDPARTAGKAKRPRQHDQPPCRGNQCRMPGIQTSRRQGPAAERLPGKATGKGKPAVAECSGPQQAGRRSNPQRIPCSTPKHPATQQGAEYYASAAERGRAG